MAIKTFAVGEVLTASDTNTYLANAGLVYVTSTTIGSGVSSVTVSNCFSSTYDNYRIVLTGGAASTQVDLGMKLGSTTTGYYFGLIYLLYGSPTVNGYSVQNTSSWPYAGSGTASVLDMCLDLRAPYLAKYTSITSQYTQSVANAGNGQQQGFLANTTQYTDFTITPNTGTITGGTITVYGYRKA